MLAEDFSLFLCLTTGAIGIHFLSIYRNYDMASLIYQVLFSKSPTETIPDMYYINVHNKAKNKLLSMNKLCTIYIVSYRGGTNPEII